MNIRDFRSNFVDCESFLESLDILVLCKTNLDDSNDSGNFSVRGYLPLIRKDSTTHIAWSPSYVKEGFPFALHGTYHQTTLRILTQVFDWLYLTQCLYSFSSIDHLLRLYVQFLMLFHLTQIPDCDFNSPALLELFLSSDVSICSTMAFPPQGNSGHVVVSVSIDFPSNSQREAPFHRIAYDCSCADQDGLCDHLRDTFIVIFTPSASAAATEFCEWVQVGIDVYIPHRKYHIKPHSSSQFSATCAAAIVHGNHFLHLY